MSSSDDVRVRIAAEECHCLFGHHHGGIILAQDGRLRYANAAAAGTLNRGLADLEGMELGDLFSPDCRRTILAQCGRIVLGKNCEGTFDAAVIRTSGGEPCEVTLSAVAVEYEGRPAILMMMLDISPNVRRKESCRPPKHSSTCSWIRRIAVCAFSRVTPDCRTSTARCAHGPGTSRRS